MSLFLKVSPTHDVYYFNFNPIRLFLSLNSLCYPRTMIVVYLIEHFSPDIYSTIYIIFKFTKLVRKVNK